MCEMVEKVASQNRLGNVNCEQSIPSLDDSFEELSFAAAADVVVGRPSTVES